VQRTYDFPICGLFPALLTVWPKPLHAQYSTQANAPEIEMNQTHVHSKEFEGFPLKHDAADWTDVFPEEGWDESEAQNIACELLGRLDED